jgi:hypothetical protein
MRTKQGELLLCAFPRARWGAPERRYPLSIAHPRLPTKGTVTRITNPAITTIQTQPSCRTLSLFYNFLTFLYHHTRKRKLPFQARARYTHPRSPRGQSTSERGLIHIANRMRGRTKRSHAVQRCTTFPFPNPRAVPKSMSRLGET